MIDKPSSTTASTFASELLARLTLLLCGGATMEQPGIKMLVGEIMTTSALLAGFSMAMTGKITTADVRSYASFLKQEFYGQHSHYCEFVERHPPTSVFGGAPKNCSDTGCWTDNWYTNHAAQTLGFEVCSLSAKETMELYPTWWDDQARVRRPAARAPPATQPCAPQHTRAHPRVLSTSSRPAALAAHRPRHSIE